MDGGAGQTFDTTKTVVISVDVESINGIWGVLQKFINRHLKPPPKKGQHKRANMKSADIKSASIKNIYMGERERERVRESEREVFPPIYFFSTFQFNIKKILYWELRRVPNQYRLFQFTKSFYIYIYISIFFVSFFFLSLHLLYFSFPDCFCLVLSRSWVEESRKDVGCLRFFEESRWRLQSKWNGIWKKNRNQSLRLHQESSNASSRTRGVVEHPKESQVILYYVKSANSPENRLSIAMNLRESQDKMQFW